MADFHNNCLGCGGSWLGGVLADRYGRTFVTIVAMAISGSCAAITGFLYDAPLILLVPVVIIWGISVITDSAQFSATVTELAEPSSVGTLLTAQTCAGFLLTLVSIQILPVVQGQLRMARCIRDACPRPSHRLHRNGAPSRRPRCKTNRWRQALAKSSDMNSHTAFLP